ncbi:MAG: MATE family efflux transporter [Pseudomonadota bacterium]
MTAQAKFLEGSLMRHVVGMSLAGSVGLLAIFLVDLVDMVFIAMLGQPELAAAVGYAATLQFFVTSASIGLAITAGALVARSLGVGDEPTARRYATHVLIVAFGLIVTLVAVVLWFVTPLVTVLGARGETLGLTVIFLTITLPAAPMMTMGMIGGAILRSHGDARRSTVATVSGGAVNAVLDPIFIFGLDMGLAGAAWASAISRAVLMAVAFWPLITTYGGFGRVRARAFLADMRAIVAIAAPAMLANSATPVGNAYVIATAAGFGEAAVAGMAVIGRVVPVAFAVVFALSGAVGPILGQNFGARRIDRVRDAYRDALIFVGVYTVLIVGLLWTLRWPLAGLFELDGLARDLLFLFAGPLSLLWFFNGVIFVGNAAFNNLAHPFYATWINWGRNTIGIFPFVWLGGQLFGAKGVLVGQLTGGVLAALVSLWLVERVMKEAAGGPPSGPFAHWELHRKMVQLFANRH